MIDHLLGVLDNFDGRRARVRPGVLLRPGDGGDEGSDEGNEPNGGPRFRHHVVFSLVELELAGVERRIQYKGRTGPWKVGPGWGSVPLLASADKLSVVTSGRMPATACGS
jgi:hypothetical protein